MVNPELELKSTDNSSSPAETSNDRPSKLKAPKNNVPTHLVDENITNTKVISFKKVVEDKLMALQDLATLEVLMPVMSRMSERLKSIKTLSSAKHLKIRGTWKTTNPTMHITKLKGIKHSNDECEISFSVFEQNSKGNKVCHESKSEIIKENGDKITRVTSAEYRIAYEVTEKIKSGKPIEREIMKMEGLN